MKKILRSIQTFFPFLHDLRFSIQFLLMKTFRTPHESDFRLVSRFNPGPEHVYVDIGSNRGEAILSMLIASNSDTKIIGFEPNPLIFSKLAKRFHANGRVQVNNVGLASENIDKELYVPFYRNWMFDGLSSFKYEKAREWLKNRLWLYNEKKLRIEKIKCQIRKLDDFQLNPYFMKIDVQGFEFEVLKGSVETINNHTPIILIEAIDSETMAFLAQFGYQFYNYSEGCLSAGVGRVNTFCSTEEKYLILSQSKA